VPRGYAAGWSKNGKARQKKKHVHHHLKEKPQGLEIEFQK
jgi:hypothetical protein